MKFDHTLWGKVVPDGSRFCHWGSKRLSQKLAKKLKINQKDKILDLCCGEGGTTDYLGKAKLVVGVDISKEAISKAQVTAKNSNALFVIANARHLPFPDNCFDKIICQDADIFMYKDKKAIVTEINRVLRPNGIFVWQSYATNERPMSPKTKKVLRDIGYVYNDLPYAPEIKDMFTSSDFSIIKFKSLHKIYLEDNLGMLRRAYGLQKEIKIKDTKKLIDLLEWEKELFKKNLWTGVLVMAKKTH